MPNAPATRRQLVTIADAADHIGMNPKTVRRYIAAGRITAYRVGPRAVRVDLNELETMLLRPIPTAAGA